MEGVAAGGGGGATGNGGGAAPVKSRAARAGGSCFVAAATTFSFPIVGWAAIIFVPRGQPTVCSKLDPRVSLRYHGTALYTIIGRTRHKEEVYSTSIFVWNSGIQEACPEPTRDRRRARKTRWLF